MALRSPSITRTVSGDMHPMIKLTPGKLAGLKAVSDHRGVIAAAAMDQRGSLQKSLAKERGAAADAPDLEVFNNLVPPLLTQPRLGHPPRPGVRPPGLEAPQRKRPAPRLREDRLRRHHPRPPARPPRRL